ncbi:MAG TPA: ABC transporter ATP-binding protein, partial [Dongiaceae bacterium]
MSLELKQVTKVVDGAVHIHETSLTLEEGTFNVLLGTTLAGKTTLMQLMAGLDKPSGGEVWFRGRNVTGMAVQRRNVSMVYQQFINYPHLTVYENIASPLRVGGVGKEEIKRRVQSVADLLRLAPMLQRKPAELSGGQQQRTA